MNQSHNPAKRTTLADAVAFQGDELEIVLEGARVSEFDFSTQERISTSRLWLHLTGIEQGTTLGSDAVAELLANPDLFVMLNMPAREFVNWFRREEWDAFDLSAVTGSEGWACTVLERSRAMCADIGQLALQMPLRAPRADKEA